jgi:hypothetical protein
MQTRHGLCIAYPCSTGGALHHPRSSVPQTLFSSGGECTQNKSKVDERLQTQCSQPHGNACETPRRNNHPRRTENISLQKYAIFREAPLAKGEGDARRRVHKHIAAERVVKCYGMTLFSNKRGPFASSLEKRLLHAAGPCQRLFTSTKTCS